MKIAILGNGKMGKSVTRLAIENGHSIVCTSNSTNQAKRLDLSLANVAIDFSTPSSAFENISHAINSGIPVISGTTAWLNKLQIIKDLCINKNGAFLYASNFSLGVNLFFELNKKLATLMKDKGYTSTINEVHHIKKVDSPSGTALALEKQINKITKNTSPINSKRINNKPGTHQITYKSIIDKIEITHTANNRDGFALGAIMAAEWIIDKKGIYSMEDVLR
jgi:4-hydroxy-tetrahydrodipicolinate reductase